MKISTNSHRFPHCIRRNTAITKTAPRSEELRITKLLARSSTYRCNTIQEVYTAPMVSAEGHLL